MRLVRRTVASLALLIGQFAARASDLAQESPAVISGTFRDGSITSSVTADNYSRVSYSLMRLHNGR